MALLLLRHALSIGNGDDDDDASTFFSVSRMCFQYGLETMCALKMIYSLLLHSLTLSIMDSFSCYGLLVFFSHATLWPGLSVYCSVEGKDRLADTFGWLASFLSLTFTLSSP